MAFEGQDSSAQLTERHTQAQDKQKQYRAWLIRCAFWAFYVFLFPITFPIAMAYRLTGRGDGLYALTRRRS
jgi:hypothetical protein